MTNLQAVTSREIHFGHVQFVRALGRHRQDLVADPRCPARNASIRRRVRSWLRQPPLPNWEGRKLRDRLCRWDHLVSLLKNGRLSGVFRHSGELNGQVIATPRKLRLYPRALITKIRSLKREKGTKQWTQRGPETHPVQSIQKSSDMLTKSIKEVLWRTVLANGCFCFHKMKLSMPDGLSAASFNQSAWLQARRHADPPTPRALWLPG